MPIVDLPSWAWTAIFGACLATLLVALRMTDWLRDRRMR